MPTLNRPPAIALLAAVGLLTALPGTAFGQATRTWVSGTGDDVNPCSRTAPCKSFAGAISKTAVNGEINAIDPGDYGAVTITKSVTILSDGPLMGISPASGDGITITAPSTASVTLRGLTITGQGTAQAGVRVTSGARVRIENTAISGFGLAGVVLAPTTGTSRLFVEHSTVSANSGDGVLLAPPTGATARALLTNDDISSNACGIVATSLGLQSGTPDLTSACGTNSAGSAGSVTAVAAHVSSNDNTGAGLLANGASAATSIAADVFTGNGIGLQPINGGTIVSQRDNQVFDNTADGSPTSNGAPAGPSGTAGPTGTAGATGAPGPVGAAGAAGPAGAVQLVTCRTVAISNDATQRCTAQLAAAPARVMASRAVTTAVLSRGGRVYARGHGHRRNARVRLVLTAHRRLAAGRYVLTIRHHGALIGRQTIRVTNA